LRELQAVGILEYTPSRSLAVSAISREDAENVYRIRAALEALVVEQFIEKAGEAQIRALARDSEVLKGAYRSGDLERIVVAKRDFYDRICSGAENPIAFDLINRLVLRTSSLRARSLVQKSRQQQSIREIEALVRAIGRRDVTMARQIAADHVHHSERSALGPMDRPRAAS